MFEMIDLSKIKTNIIFFFVSVNIKLHEIRLDLSYRLDICHHFHAFYCMLCFIDGSKTEDVDTCTQDVIELTRSVLNAHGKYLIYFKVLLEKV